MSLTTDYDPNNIFAKIIRGEAPCVKIFESERILSFMDAFPQCKGHCLVIHKTATATNLLDIDPNDLHELIDTVQVVARAIRESLKPDGIRLAQFNGAPAGQTVFHLHFHILPVFEGAATKPHGQTGPAPAETLEPLAAQIRAAI